MRKWKKIINALCIISGIMIFVLAIVSVYVSNEKLSKNLVRIDIALMFFIIIFGGIGTRVFQIKEATSAAKKIYQSHKDRVAKNAPENLIDPVSGALKERKDDDSIVVPLDDNDSKRFPKIAWFYIILLVLFLGCPFVGVIMFRLNKFLIGGLLFGFGVLCFATIIIVSNVYTKKQQRNSQRGEYGNSVSRGEYDNSARNLVNIASSMDGNVSPQSTTTEPKYAFSNREVPVELSRASVSKAEEIWKMQKFAFADLLRKYGDYDTSPANETIDKVKSRFEDPNTYHYFIKVKDKNVGVIRIVDPKTGEKKRLAQIFIMPEYRRNRYAYSAIKKAEKIHGEKDWEVETIFQERYLVKFYMHLGYKTTDKIERVNSKMVLVGLEK